MSRFTEHPGRPHRLLSLREPLLVDWLSTEAVAPACLRWAAAAALSSVVELCRCPLPSSEFCRSDSTRELELTLLGLSPQARGPKSSRAAGTRPEGAQSRRRETRRDQPLQLRRIDPRL